MNITETNVQVLPLSALHNNTGQIEGVPANPRILKDDAYKALVQSLQADNLTGVLPLKVYNHDGQWIVLGGNMRLRALKDIGAKEVACIVVPNNTDTETLKKIVITDNSTFGEWDLDMLANEWDADQLADWGVELPQIADPDEAQAQTADKKETENKSHVIIASVTLFGQTEETIVSEELTQEQAEQLLSVVRSEGAPALIKRLLQ